MKYLKMIASWPIRKKFMLLIALAFLPGAGIVIANGLEERQGQLEAARRETLVLVESLSAQQEQIAAATKQMLSTLAQLPQLQSLDAKACSALFRELRDRHSFYSAMGAVTPDGNMFANAQDFEPGSINISGQKHIKHAIESLDFSAGEYMVGRLTNVPAIYYSHPVLDPKKNLIAIVNTGFRLDEYAGFIKKANLPEGSAVVITDHKGVRLYRLPENDATPIGKPLLPEVLALCLGDLGHGTYELTSQDGVKRIYAFKQLRLRENSPPYLCIFVGIPKDAILHKANLAIVRSLSILGLPAAFSMFLAWFFGGFAFINPINRLVATAQRFGEGEMSARTGLPHTPDELGRLAGSFDAMASLLETRNIERRNAEEALRESEERYRHISSSISDFAFSCIKPAGGDYAIDWLVGAVENITGYSIKEILDSRCWRFLIYPEDLPIFDENIIGREPGSSGHCELRLVHKDGSIRWIRAASRVVESSGFSEPHRLFGSCVDISEHKLAEELIRIRLSLLEFAASHSLEELLQKTVDEVGALTNSPIGFYHFVESDQKSLSLQAWSSQTTMEFCKAVDKGLHEDVDKAGVWVDCVRERKPVIYNDYSTLSHRSGLPEGHAAVLRVLVVPIVRSDRIGAILGIGNKPTDYNEKDVEVVSYLADLAWEITERKRAEQKAAQLAAIVRFSEDAIIGKNLEGIITSWNRGAEKIYGYTESEAVSKPISILLAPEREDELPRIFETILSGEHIERYETMRRRKDGRDICMSLTISPVRNAEGRIIAASTIARDITDRIQAEDEQKKLQAQLNQAQKMESVGRLAGGVAHDFNNMLGIILGHAEIALDQVEPTQPIFDNLQEIRKAAERSADLTRQLLAFARKQTVAPKVLDLNETVEGMLNMLRRLIGEDIDLAWLPDKNLWPVKVDPSQIDQILANLCINARDAIEGTGKVTIETGTTVFDAAYCAEHAGFLLGEYVLLAVSDDGCGMAKETLGKLFEPFFTTKEMGKGTGLGLATVYGIVKQNNGFINVYSEPGQGTIFRIYLPRTDAHLSDAQGLPKEKKDLRGTETVLLVEDEGSILALGKAILERQGYLLLTANNPVDALHLAQNHSGPIHLLITDVVMPGMNGKDLSEKLRDFKPEFKCIFMSGYTANVIAHHGILDEGIHFLQKPFSGSTLSEKVREVLDT